MLLLAVDKGESAHTVARGGVGFGAGWLDIVGDSE